MTRVAVSSLPRGTPLGRRAGLVGMGFLFAGFNTGNNLFYLVFTVLAACELCGFVLARWSLRRLEGEIVTPRRGRAGTPVRATMRVTNRGRWLSLPALAWRIETADGAAAVVRTPLVPPGGAVTGTGRLTPERRGLLELRSIEARTDFPVGLARLTLRLEPPRARTLVTPRPAPASALSAGRRRGDVRLLTRPKGSGEEPVEAKDYRPGDDARQIDWKASARAERLLLRERRGEPPRALLVRLDRSGPEGPMLEARVSRAAGAACAALDRGVAVGFASDEIELLPRSGPSQRRRILDYLALVRPAASAPSPAASASWPGSTHVAGTATGPSSTVPTPPGRTWADRLDSAAVPQTGAVPQAVAVPQTAVVPQAVAVPLAAAVPGAAADGQGRTSTLTDGGGGRA